MWVYKSGLCRSLFLPHFFIRSSNLPFIHSPISFLRMCLSLESLNCPGVFGQGYLFFCLSSKLHAVHSHPHTPKSHVAHLLELLSSFVCNETPSGPAERGRDTAQKTGIPTTTLFPFFPSVNDVPTERVCLCVEVGEVVISKTLGDKERGRGRETVSHVVGSFQTHGLVFVFCPFLVLPWLA